MTARNISVTHLCLFLALFYVIPNHWYTYALIFILTSLATIITLISLFQDFIINTFGLHKGKGDSLWGVLAIICDCASTWCKRQCSCNFTTQWMTPLIKTFLFPDRHEPPPQRNPFESHESKPNESHESKPNESHESKPNESHESKPNEPCENKHNDVSLPQELKVENNIGLEAQVLGNCGEIHLNKFTLESIKELRRDIKFFETDSVLVHILNKTVGRSDITNETANSIRTLCGSSMSDELLYQYVLILLM
jgi:hypothetical protein